MNVMSTTGFAPNRAAAMLAARPTSADPEFDPAFCWQAVYSRDRRFDGRFFAGITTTGVYCRPVCPVSFGHIANVRWFHSAEAAEAAGFRPCKRCRPGTSPGSSAWFGTLAVVSRALKLIFQGALDNGSLKQLAARVGLGPRHLRRLFDHHLGASPLKIARSHRVNIARTMILETKVAITEIASRTGFRSVRQFNHSIRAAFGQSPTKIRALQGVSKSVERKTGIVVHLPYRTPFDWYSLIEFLKARATPGVETVADGFYRRTIEIDDQVGAIEVWHEADHSRLSMRILGLNCHYLIQIVQRVRQMFDLEADMIRIGQHLSQHVKLAALLAQRPGLRVPGAWDGFELSVRAVLGEQLTVVDEPALVQCLVGAFGRPLRFPILGLSHLFPRPEILAKVNLTSVGIPTDQAATICSLARAVLEGKMTFDSGRGFQATLPRLRADFGLNHDIVSYIAMRGFGEPDAFPHTDRGLRQALSTRGKPVSPTELVHIFKEFRPWSAYAAMHFSANCNAGSYNGRGRP